MVARERANVLLVDDRPEDLLALEVVLEDLGENLVKAASGEAALRCLLQQDFALVLLDVQMPGMDGFETAALIRSRKRSRNTPIIFLTSPYRSEQFVFRGYSLGAVDYLLKPFIPEILKAKVAAFVDMHRKSQQIARQAEELAEANQTLETEIAERKRIEERLRQAEAALRKSHHALQNRFEAAVRASGQLLYEWDAKTNAVSYGNAEALGYTQEEMGDGLAHWTELIHPDDRDAFNQEVERSVQTKTPFHLEYRVRRKDGEFIYVEDRGYLILGEDGNVRSTIGFVADISERRKLEEQFRQSQKLEAVGRLAGGIAHDFNNLLGVIIGFSDLLRDRIKGNEGALKYVTEVRKAGDSAVQLTRQLLAFSRKQALEPRVLDLNGIISDQGKMLHRLIGEDIKLVTFGAPDLGQVKADPGQIEQVILNLVVNARDAMPKGGKLTVETANVVLDESYAREHIAVVPGRYVMLAVSDTGVGMDADIQAHIFEPFFTTKEREKGTGLGLATVYGIVKQSGGNIWVYSEPGKGTTFKIYLPRVDAKAEVTGVPVSQEVAKGGSEAILLVEDSESLRALARELLERAGYTVLEALDGSEAARIAEQCNTPIDLLLTDVVMPGMSGRDVADQVKRRHPATKVLFMSGYADNSIVHHGILEEGVALLSKPFDRESLVRRVRQVLDGSS